MIVLVMIVPMERDFDSFLMINHKMAVEKYSQPNMMLVDDYETIYIDDL